MSFLRVGWPGAVLVGCAAGDEQVASLLLWPADEAPPADAWPTSGGLPGLRDVRVLSRAEDAGAALFWDTREQADAALPGLPAAPDQTWFELPVSMDDPTEPAADEPWLAIVRIPRPWYATRGVVVSKFRDAVPDYEAVDGLVHKDFCLTGTGEFGGIYQWTDPDAAAAFYDQAWVDGVVDRYDEAPRLDQWEVAP